MNTASGRPLDLVRVAASVASANGWSVVASLDDASEAASTLAGRVSVLVRGGDLREAALLILRVRQAPGSAARVTLPEAVSEHLPRPLPGPPDRVVQGRAITVEVVEHPSEGTLDELLARVQGLTAGEAVTVLASVARGLAELHATGLAGVRLSPETIGFRENGCPVLTGTEDLRPLDPSSARADVAGFAALAGAVCAAVAGSAGSSLLAAATGEAHRSWHDVVVAVLGSADPTAIALEARTPIADPGHRADGVALRRAERLLDALGARPLARGFATARAWAAARPLLLAVGAAPLVAVVLVLLALPGTSGS